MASNFDTGSFLTGRFRHIIQLSYAVDPVLLRPYLPPYTELDLYDNSTFVSLVGLQPLQLRVYGIPVPWFRHQAQVNLRFYVRRRVGTAQWRHGVVFISQVIPHRLTAWAANLIFNERTAAHPIDCTIDRIGHEAERVRYSWFYRGEQHFVRTAFRRQPLFEATAAEQDFFVDRHWGYSLQRDGGCLEYRFDHPPWKTYRAMAAEAVAAVGDFYGARFTEVLRIQPDYAFGCPGSRVALHKGHRL